MSRCLLLPHPDDDAPFTGSCTQIGSPFAFARRRGLAGLRALVDGLTDETTPVFVALQGEENYNVVYRILPVILVRKKAAPISEITHAERQVALDLVHTICVIHPRSRQYFGSHQYIEALVGFLRIEQLQYATLQALEGALVDSGSNQEVSERVRAPVRAGLGVSVRASVTAGPD